MSMQSDFSPLSQACVKALKEEDKRKIAASEIEKMTAEFSMSNNLFMVNQLVDVLGEKFCLSTNSMERKGGLVGLGAVMVGFHNGSKPHTLPPVETVTSAVQPILTCFLDSDPRVRQCACESLFNVTKVAQRNILTLFEDIFDNIAKVIADPDIGVRKRAQLIDGLLRDIVGMETSNIGLFVPNLENYITTRNPFTQLFILDWIKFLNSYDSIDMVKYLPQLLDGIFGCLYDSKEDVKSKTINLLSELLPIIVALPTDRSNIPALTVILLKHARNDTEGDAQYNAMNWIRQFISLMDDDELINFSPEILSAILPCLATSYTQNGSIRSNNKSFARDNICDISSLVNSLLLQQVIGVLETKRNSLRTKPTTNDLEPILEVLIKELQKQDHPIITLAILEWIKKLNREERELIFVHTLQQKLFQILLDALSAPSDAVVRCTLQVIADIFCFDGTDEQQVVSNVNEEATSPQSKEEASVSDIDKKKSPAKHQPILQKGPSISGGSTKKVAISTEPNQTIQQRNANISRFIEALYKTFRDKESKFKERVTFIIVNLCNMVRPSLIYRTFADILKEEKADLIFAHNLVHKLNEILLTTKDLYSLRSSLNNEDDPETTSLFNSLYHAWCHSPISALTLCLLSKNYELASEIVKDLSQRDVNLELLKQINWVIHLIETPIFVSLRMKLLDFNSNPNLFLCFESLLMILPLSTSAYRDLKERLDRGYQFANYSKSSPANQKPPVVSKESKSLMKHYLTLQNQRLKLVNSSEKDE